MSIARMQKIRKVLAAMKRTETARLKAALQEAAVARSQAAQIRDASRQLPAVTTVTEMQIQSNAQLQDERNARDLEAVAADAERAAIPLREALAHTLGREQAAEMLERKVTQETRAASERRSEGLPSGIRTPEREPTR